MMMADGKKRLNQFGDYEDTTNMSVDDWKHRWDKQQTQFHVPMVHPMLKKHLDTMVQGRKKLRFFLPLCGKSLDLKWLVEQGHEVVGCEAVDKGCHEFFKEHNLQYTSFPMKACEGVVYQAKGCPVTLYRCDFFQLKRDDIGQFDCVWDRGSFVAIPVTERQRYVDIIVPLMKEDCRYLLDCFLVNNDQFGGPPFNCAEKDVSTFYGSYCTVTKIDERDAFTEWQKSWGISYFVEEMYLIGFKRRA